MKRMLVIWVVSFSFVISSVPASAQELALSSSAQDWSLSLKLPKLRAIDIYNSAERYRYFGKSDEGVFMSLHVEPVVASVPGSHQHCKSRYWTSEHEKLKEVQKGSVVFSSAPNYEQVSYDYTLSIRGQQFAMPNTHFYFLVGDDLCADLHLGASPNARNLDAWPHIVHAAMTSLPGSHKLLARK